MAVIYEWDIEDWEYDNTNEIEITDHWHENRLDAYPIEELKMAIEQGRLVLVRNENGYRDYAYVNSGNLPESFYRLASDGEYHETNLKVPKKYLKEFSKIVI